MTLLTVEGLRKRYAGAETDAVRGISLSLEPGEVVSLLGPSGCGKTTTLRAIAGLEECDDGEIVLDGRSLTRGGRHLVQPENRNMGMVFQSYSIWPHMTVAANIRLGLKAKRFPRAELDDRIHRALATVDLEGYADRPATDLSGGQQQRVALARSVALEPKLLLFDEPLSNLDARLRVRMRTDLRELLRQLGTSAVYVTHDQAEAFVISDRILVMKQGDVLQSGTPQEVYRHPINRFVAEFIGAANVLEGTVATTADGTFLLLDGNQRIALADEWGLDLLADEKVEVCLRPESVVLCGDAGEVPARPGSVLPAQVVRATYVGSGWEYRVTVGSAALEVTATIDQVYEVGSTVQLWIPLSAPVPLGDAAHARMVAAATADVGSARGR